MSLDLSRLSRYDHTTDTVEMRARCKGQASCSRSQIARLELTLTTLSETESPSRNRQRLMHSWSSLTRLETDCNRPQFCIASSLRVVFASTSPSAQGNLILTSPTLCLAFNHLGLASWKLRGFPTFPFAEPPTQPSLSLRLSWMSSKILALFMIALAKFWPLITPGSRSSSHKCYVRLGYQSHKCHATVRLQVRQLFTIANYCPYSPLFYDTNSI